MIVRNTSTDKRSLNAGGGEGVYTRDADQGDVYKIENYR